MNAHGRRFVRGKALEDDLRSVIVDTILNEGGDVAAGISQTSFTGGPGARRVKLYIVYARIYSILLKIM